MLTHADTTRRKLRSETSDRMDGWTVGKAEVGRVREEKKRSEKEDQRRKKMQVREKVGKSGLIVFSNDLWLWRVEK